MTTTEILASTIPCGKENAISRSALRAALNLSDRKMRREIEQARNNGLLIANDGDGYGYYQIESLDEAERQYRQDTARAMAILARRKSLYAMLKSAGRLEDSTIPGQMELEDCRIGKTLHEIDLHGKCGSCKYYMLIGETACGSCLKKSYGDNVVHENVRRISKRRVSNGN